MPALSTTQESENTITFKERPSSVQERNDHTIMLNMTDGRQGHWLADTLDPSVLVRGEQGDTITLNGEHAASKPCDCRALLDSVEMRVVALETVSGEVVRLDDIRCLLSEVQNTITSISNGVAAKAAKDLSLAISAVVDKIGDKISVITQELLDKILPLENSVQMLFDRAASLAQRMTELENPGFRCSSNGMQVDIIDSSANLVGHPSRSEHIEQHNSPNIQQRDEPEPKIEDIDATLDEYFRRKKEAAAAAVTATTAARSHLPSRFQGIFASDAVRNPSEKQITRMVNLVNKNELDEQAFVDIFSSRSQRKQDRASKLDNTHTALQECANLRIMKYSFTRRTPTFIAHKGARHLGMRTNCPEGCYGSEEFDGAWARLDREPAGSQLGVSPQVGSWGVADGSPAEPALVTTEQFATGTSMSTNC